MDASIPVPTDSEALSTSLLTILNQQDEGRHRRSAYPVPRQVSRDGHDELLHLRGRIPSDYLKQIAQAVLGKVESGRLIINHIEVVAPTGGNSIGHRFRRATTTGELIESRGQVLNPLWGSVSLPPSHQGSHGRCWF